MKVYTYTEARQHFSSVLDAAKSEGMVSITRRDGSVFLVQPVKKTKSPLDIEGVSANLSASDIVDFIHAGRDRSHSHTLSTKS